MTPTFRRKYKYIFTKPAYVIVYEKLARRKYERMWAIQHEGQKLDLLVKPWQDRDYKVHSQLEVAAIWLQYDKGKHLHDHWPICEKCLSGDHNNYRNGCLMRVQCGKQWKRCVCSCNTVYAPSKRKCWCSNKRIKDELRPGWKWMPYWLIRRLHTFDYLNCTPRWAHERDKNAEGHIE